MFEVGQKIVYPMYGAGIVTGIEDKEILGEVRSYYCVSIPHSKMEASVPVDNSETLGVRDIIDESEIAKVLEVLEQESDAMQANWNRRYRENMERMQTGDIMQVASVVRNLVRSDRVKPLSTGEKKLLGTAKLILESELVYASGKTREEIDEMVESHI